MADIVQLKEGGVAKYLKTHVNAIDGVDGNLVKASGNETIVGNKNFTGLQSNGTAVEGITRKTLFQNWTEGFYGNENENRDLGEVAKITQVILVVGRYTGAGEDPNYGYQNVIFDFPETRLNVLHYIPIISYDGGGAATSVPEVAVKKVKFVNESGKLKLKGDAYNSTNARSKGYTIKAIYTKEK